MMLTDQQKRDRLEKALLWGGSTHTVSDIVSMHGCGRVQMWEQGDGAIVTEIVDYPQVKAVNYFLISGVLQDCLALDERITAWALSEGCKIGTASGRRGWARAGAPYGWRLQGYTFSKRLAP